MKTNLLLIRIVAGLSTPLCVGNSIITDQDMTALAWLTAASFSAIAFFLTLNPTDEK